MKQLMILCLTTIGFALSAKAQVITDTLNVAGVCGMCEERIENAAYIKGVKKAEWDKNTQELVLVYKSNKVSLDDISAAIQAAGHDTEKGPAKPGTYEQINECCRYRELEVH